MGRGYIKERKLSVFTYFFILSCVVIVTILVLKELGLVEGFEEIRYQKEVEPGSVEEENKYYIKKIKDEYGINISYGENSKNFVSNIDANNLYDENIVNNNIKIVYNALKKYPSDVFDIFKEEKYSLYLMIVSDFNANNIALASKNTLNQYRIYLSNNDNFERSFHHEFFHVLEYYMEGKVKYLYHSWNSYNPYGYEYQPNVSLLTDEYVYSKYNTEDENRNTYFITKYSKVSEKEDRAELFAEMMTLNKKEGYLRNGTNIRSKIGYLLNEIYENISISDFYFSTYVN